MSQPKRRTRVDLDTEDDRSGRRSAARADVVSPKLRREVAPDAAKVEVKLPPRRQAAVSQGDRIGATGSAPVITDPNRKVTRKTPS